MEKPICNWWRVSQTLNPIQWLDLFKIDTHNLQLHILFIYFGLGDYYLSKQGGRLNPKDSAMPESERRNKLNLKKPNNGECN